MTTYECEWCGALINDEDVYVKHFSECAEKRKKIKEANYQAKLNLLKEEGAGFNKAQVQYFRYLESYAEQPASERDKWLSNLHNQYINSLEELEKVVTDVLTDKRSYTKDGKRRGEVTAWVYSFV